MRFFAALLIIAVTCPACRAEPLKAGVEMNVQAPPVYRSYSLGSLMDPDQSRRKALLKQEREWREKVAAQEVAPETEAKK